MPSGFGTQGSSFLATLGFVAESRWDSSNEVHANADCDLGCLCRTEERIIGLSGLRQSRLLAAIRRAVLRFVALLSLALGGPVLAQSPTNAAAATTDSVPATVNPATLEEPEKEWELSLSVYTYVVPDDREYVQPTLTVDRGWLHLEARYNYEDLDTGSVWIGYNLSAGDEFWVTFTPMVGGVFGNTTGVAPGCRLDVGWWKLELYSELEYLFDTGDSSGDFLYSWSELTLAPTEWFRFGYVAQRTRTYDTGLEIQRGPLVGFSFKRLDLTTIVFNPEEDRPTWVLAVGFGF
jgi:hypothetical protein